MSAVLHILLLVLTVGVIFVNGWTDAPNAITSAVSTGAITYKKAVRLAAVCNLAGIVCMSFISSSVADTITSMVSFEGGTQLQSVAALCAAMLTIVMFAVIAWYFGIPTSESHALIAALTGAGLAVGGASSIDNAAWSRVIIGLVMAIVMGFALGSLFTRLFGGMLERCKEKTLDKLQVISAGGMAFMHGAQDGQKFIAVLVIVDLLTRGQHPEGSVNIREHWLALALCAVAMALGTSVGGKRIIISVGRKMVSLQKPAGVCADFAGAVCLFIASLTGIPMSTSQTKTTAMMGAGLAADKDSSNGKIMLQMFLTWFITFPVCCILGYVLTRFFTIR